MSSGSAAGVAVLGDGLLRRRAENSWSAVAAPAHREPGGLRASPRRRSGEPPTSAAPGRDRRGSSQSGPARAPATSGRERAPAAGGEPRDRLSATPIGVRIGVIADDHGHLDPMVLKIFAGVTHIIHAGDIMDPQILESLATIAPVTAVAGNMDSQRPTSALPREVTGEVAGVRFVVGHKRKRLLKDLAAGNINGLAKGEVPDLVVYGHDHMPAAAWVDGTLFLNPGSASAPYEEDDGPTVAVVEAGPAGLAVRFVPLAHSETTSRAGAPKRAGLKTKDE